MFGHVIMLGVAVSSSLVSASVARVPCGSLANHSPLLPDNVSSLTATPVAIAALEVGSTSYNNTIAVCRVTGSIKFGCKGNNTLNFEVWLPDELDWNQRYLSVGECPPRCLSPYWTLLTCEHLGNGGFAGTIDYAAMLTNLNSGYAVGG